MSTYTVDMTIRLYVDAESQIEAETKAVNVYAKLSPDGIAQYGNVISKEGMWYLCEHGDDTDEKVWNPYSSKETT